MKCPKCNHEVPEGSKFCNECGSRLQLTCPECNTINPPGSKFCSEIISDKLNDFTGIAMANFYLGCLFWEYCEFEKSLLYFNKALELAKPINLVLLIVTIYSSIILCVHIPRGETDTAYQLNKAIEIMKECGADGWLERYEKELAELE